VSERDRRLQLSRPWTADEEIAAVSRVLQGGWLTQGPEVERLEEQVREATGRRHAMAVSSGTAALQLAVGALELEPGSEVLIPDFTFPATANAVLLNGLVPRIVDIDVATYNMRPEAAAEAAGPGTRGMMPVHQFGLMSDMGGLGSLARERGMRVVEDAACALGARSPVGAAGCLGDAGCYSFHPRKTITTGEGGMVVCNDDQLAAHVRRMRNHGIEYTPDGPVFVEPGFNLRMPDICAAIGNVQLRRLDEAIERNRALAEVYDEWLAEIPWIETPPEPEGYRHTRQTYAALLAPEVDRKPLMDRLSEREIETSIGAQALHRLGYLAPYLDDGGYPGGERAAECVLCLPLHPGMTEVDVDRTVAALKECGP